MFLYLIQWTANTEKVFAGDMGIDHGCLDVVTTEQLLNRSDVVPIFQQVRCKTVSESMHCCSFRYPRPLNRMLEGLLENRRVEEMAPDYK